MAFLQLAVFKLGQLVSFTMLTLVDVPTPPLPALQGPPPPLALLSFLERLSLDGAPTRISAVHIAYIGHRKNVCDTDGHGNAIQAPHTETPHSATSTLRGVLEQSWQLQPERVNVRTCAHTDWSWS